MEEFKKHWIKILMITLTAGILWANVQYTISDHDEEIQTNKLSISGLQSEQHEIKIINAEILLELKYVNKSLDRLNLAVDRLNK